MIGKYYVDVETKSKILISDRDLSHREDLLEVDSLPPDLSKNYRYVDGQWQEYYPEVVPEPLVLPIHTEDPVDTAIPGTVLFYRKNDGKFYEKNSFGTSKPIEGDGSKASGGGSGGEVYDPVVTSIEPNSIYLNTTRTIKLTGSLFTLNTTISVIAHGTEIEQIPVTKTNYVNSQEINFEVNAGAEAGSLGIIVNNGSGETTIDPAITVRLSSWKSLKLFGFDFTHGNEADKDIRYHPDMTLTRDTEGIWFAGKDLFESFVKFEFLRWERKRDRKTVKFIVILRNGRCMVGIGSTEMNEASHFFYQGELQIYIGVNQAIGLYGNRGEMWQGESTSIPDARFTTKYHRLEIEDNGEPNKTVRIYDLPDADSGSWDNTDDLIYEGAIDEKHSADAETIMPMCTAWNGEDMKLVAVQVV